MTEVLHFTGFIKGVKYRAYLTEPLQKIAIEDFDQHSSAYGILQVKETEIADSKWVSPKM